jgi:hypothetical protein
MTKKILLPVTLLLMLAGTVSAQKNSPTYKTAAGVKIYPGGLTLKHFVKENQAVDFIGYFWQKGTRITGLYEFHGNISSSENFKWYVGPGVHVGLFSNKYYDGGVAVGVDGVLGLDYKFKDAPINLSLDWQPSFEFGDYEGFQAGWGGLGIRYTF